MSVELAVTVVTRTPGVSTLQAATPVSATKASLEMDSYVQLLSSNQSPLSVVLATNPGGRDAWVRALMAARENLTNVYYCTIMAIPHYNSRLLLISITVY